MGKINKIYLKREKQINSIFLCRRFIKEVQLLKSEKYL